MLEGWKRRRAGKRLRGGDGRSLEPFRWWQLLSGRKLLYLRLPHGNSPGVEYAVDVRMWGKQAGDAGAAHLYRDGSHHAHSTLPAAFPVAGGTIEVALSSFGLRRAHYIHVGGAQQWLDPDPHSAIGRRLGFERDHPGLSRWISSVSIVLLIAGIGLNLLQLLEPISQIPPLTERFGSFTSPIQLPLWLNLGLGLGAAAASVERALRLRYHWLLDAAAN